MLSLRSSASKLVTKFLRTGNCGARDASDARVVTTNGSAPCAGHTSTGRTASAKETRQSFWGAAVPLASHQSADVGTHDEGTFVNLLRIPARDFHLASTTGATENARGETGRESKVSEQQRRSLQFLKQEAQQEGANTPFGARLVAARARLQRIDASPIQCLGSTPRFVSRETERDQLGKASREGTSDRNAARNHARLRAEAGDPESTL